MKIGRWFGLALAVVSACTSSQGPEVAVVPATAVAFELGPDVRVWVDDAELGTTPVPSREVTAGPHTIRVKTACGEVVREGFEVAAEQTTVVKATDLPGFGTATLRVTARTHLGEALRDVVVFVGAQPLTTPKDDAPWVLPACRVRLRIAAAGRQDLAGVQETIEVAAGGELTRSVVLAPGPEMVRIPGGSIVFGPNEFVKKDWAENYEGSPPWDHDPRHGAEVTLPAFEIDESEVTVAQFLACRRAAKRPFCFSEQECPEVGGCAIPAGKIGVHDGEKCLVRKFDQVEPSGSTGDLPMNCVKLWEAEKYCRWVGKRLPTDVEWQYVARSRRTDFSQPWGNEDDVDCARSVCIPELKKEASLEPVCSHPGGNTVDGVCDMMGNVSEVITHQEVPGRWLERHGVALSEVAGSSVREHANFMFQLRTYSAFDDEGFRCVRDIPEADRKAERG